MTDVRKGDYSDENIKILFANYTIDQHEESAKYCKRSRNSIPSAAGFGELDNLAWLCFESSRADRRSKGDLFNPFGHSGSGIRSTSSASGQITPEGINVWTSNGPEGQAISSLAIDPSNLNTIYAGSGAGVFKSTDGGASWSRSDGGLTGSVELVVVDPVNTDTVYAGTRAGVFKSINGGASWSAANIGLTPLPVVALAIDTSGSGTLYAACFEEDDGPFFEFNLLKSTNGGASWIKSTGLFGYGDAIVTDPGHPNLIYAGTQCGQKRDCSGRQSGEVIKSTDGGASWRGSDTRLVGLSVVHALVIDPGNPKTIYAGGDHCNVDCGSSASVFKSTDRGASWTSSVSGLPTGNVLALAIAPASPNFIYAGTDSGVYRSTDGGGSWSPFNDGLTSLSVNALAIDPSGTFLHAGTATGVFDYQYPAPTIVSVSVVGKKLQVFGENFEGGAVILLNGEEQKTRNADEDPKTALIGKKAGKKIKPGDTLQVRNPNGTTSEEFTFIGTLERPSGYASFSVQF